MAEQHPTPAPAAKAVPIPKQKTPMSNFLQFFASRFFLGEPALWRLMGMIKSLRHWVIAANAALTVATMLGALGLVSLMPLFSVVFGPEAAESYGQKHHQVKTEQVAPASPTAPAAPVAKAGGATSQTPAQAPAQAQPPANATAEPAKTVQVSEKIQKRYPFIGRLLEFSAVKSAVDGAQAKWREFYGWASASTERFVVIYAAFILTLLTLQGIFQFIGNFIMGRVAVWTTSGLLRKLYANVLRQEMLFFNNTSTGSLLNTCYREIFELQSLITMLTSTRLLIPVYMVIYFGALVYISPGLSLLLLGLMPVVILPTTVLTRRIKQQMKKELDEESGAMDVMSQGLHNILAIKTFGAERLEVQAIEPSIHYYIQASKARRIAQSLTGPMVDVLNMFIMLTVFVVAAFVLPDSFRDPKTLPLFMFALTRFYKPLRDLMSLNIRMQRARQVCSHIFTLLDRQPQIDDAPNAVDFPTPWRELVLDNVHLAYKVKRKGGGKRLHTALAGVEMTIRRGEAIALVGPNGAGKSSIVNAITRLYDVTGGEVRVDGTPLKQIRLASLREKICLITQHPILFNRSIADNIAFGLEGVTREEVIEAAKATRAHDFIMKLPQDYDTFAGEQGRLLSGGERQRVVLARAFVRRPEILILDEPTTGLDQATLADFLELIGEMRRRGVTIIYITHEPSQLALVDRIYRITPERKVIEETLESLGVAAPQLAGKSA